MFRATNLECAESGGALDFLAFAGQRIQSGVALRLPPHSTLLFQQPVRKDLNQFPQLPLRVFRVLPGELKQKTIGGGALLLL